jgi:hypothetical protein
LIERLNALVDREPGDIAAAILSVDALSADGDASPLPSAKEVQPPPIEAVSKQDQPAEFELF